MRKLLFLMAVSASLLSCSQKINQQSANHNEQVDNGVVTQQDLKDLQSLIKSESESSLLVKRNASNHFMLLANSENFEEIHNQIISSGGKILFFDSKTGYIHFTSKAKLAMDLLNEGNLQTFMIDREVDFKPYLPKADEKSLSPVGVPSEETLYPVNLMKVDELAASFEAQYGVKLDGSETTVVVVDTGLDMSRTDAFQDRIVELRGLRSFDNARLTVAKEEELDGVKYLSAKVDNVELKILKTDRLSLETTYYLGYFSEKQFSKTRDKASYDKYDFNQDGKDTAVFPIVAFKNAEGQFVAYVNVNDKLMYGNAGDISIEDENMLMDFSWVAQNRAEARYTKNAQEIKSFYNYTTRLDIIDASGRKLVKDRNKGKVNLAINVAPGLELDEAGAELVKVAGTDENPIYNINIAGFDIMGHGTHCAGIAAGKYLTADQFSSQASKAKIVGISYLGGGATSTAFFDMVLRTIQTHKNPVFNFSFGGNTFYNDSQTTWAKTMDKVAKVYNVAFVKAAGNEGPGINSIGTDFASNIISVANYHSTDSRMTHGSGDYEPNQFFVSNSSSRGPMIDGTLKPDIGAPGWVLAALPIANGMGAKGHSFEYWSGTSMATPNTVQVIALLYDAYVKAGMPIPENSVSPISIDKVLKAIRNSALPYNSYKYSKCVSTETSNQTACEMKEFEYKFSWLDGGAGRINALGAWEIVKDIANDKPTYFAFDTKSHIDGYNKRSVGHYALNKVVPYVYFKVNFDELDNELTTIVRNEQYKLVIPADIDWLSFSDSNVQKERLVDIFGTSEYWVKVYIDQAKLTENGRVKGGIHHALLKGFNVKSPEYFDFVFPITIVGNETAFDALVDKGQYGARGFVPAEKHVSHFIPINTDDSAVILDLNVGSTNPGEVMMSVYYLGVELERSLFGASTSWAVSHSDVGQGRGHLRYVLSGLPKGQYEVVIQSAAEAPAEKDGIKGSFYELQATHLQMSMKEGKIFESSKNAQIQLSGVANGGTPIRVASAIAAIVANEKKDVVTVKDKETVEIPITIAPGVGGVTIATKYRGTDAKMDLDMALIDSTGAVVGQSAYEGSDETIELDIALPGTYTLILEGYEIPTGEEQFDLSIKQNLLRPTTLATSFEGPDSVKLKDGFFFREGYSFDFKATFDKAKLVTLSGLTDYKPVVAVVVKAVAGNNNETVTVLSKVLE